MAMGPDQTIYVADVLNWRFQVFARTAPTFELGSLLQLATSRAISINR